MTATIQQVGKQPLLLNFKHYKASEESQSLEKQKKSKGLAGCCTLQHYLLFEGMGALSLSSSQVCSSGTQLFPSGQQLSLQTLIMGKMLQGTK